MKVIQDSSRPGYLKKAKGKLENFSKFLGDKEWLAGKEVRCLS